MNRIWPLALVASVGCHAAIRQTPPAVRGGAVARVQSPGSCADFMHSLLRVQLTRAELGRAFGRPDSVVATVQQNIYDAAAVDSVFTLFYPGLEAVIVKPAGKPDFAWTVDVLDNRYLRYPTLGIGGVPEDVVAVLGQPEERTEEQLVYTCGVGPDEPITFFLKSGRVVRVTQQYYVD